MDKEISYHTISSIHSLTKTGVQEIITRSSERVTGIEDPIRPLSKCTTQASELASGSDHLLALYRCILDSIPDAIVVHQEGVITFANQGAVHLMALPDNVEPMGMSLWSFFHPSTLVDVKASMKELSSKGRVGSTIPTAEHTIVRYDGSIFTGEIRSILINDSDIPVIMSLTRDVSVENKLKNDLKYIAYHDVLTSLPNRRFFTEYLYELLSTSHSSETHHHAILFIDMDRFKDINDTYGHELGDDALSMMGTRLKSVLPDGCLLARIGGDEFAVLCKNVSNLDEVLGLANRFLNLFTTPIRISDKEFVITPSIGVALYPEWGTDIDTLLKHADLAMYSAKRRGGNKIEIYHPEESAAAQERIRIENGLRRALKTGEFKLHYQPKVNLKTGELHSVEALVRWTPPGEEIVPPQQFISIAEESGLIASIGEWVLWEACHQNHLWQKKGYPPMVVSVNVSPKQFQLMNMHHTIKRVLLETGLSPEWLEIEITEGLLIKNSIEIADVLGSIRALGVTISIDDFGTGYSSLKYLRLFEPNALKIDQSFVSNMMANRDDMSIVSAIIQLAHSLNMDVVAEGIETAEQSLKLQSEGCSIGQGYFFSRPVVAEEIEESWLRGACPSGV